MSTFKGKSGFTGKAGLAGLAGCLLLATALTGCGGDSSKGSEGAAASPSAQASGSPAVQKPVELSWMVNQVVLPESEGEKLVEEKFNVKLDIISISNADYVQRQQLMMSTGEVSDVLFVLDPNELKKYADQGLLAEVPMDLIAKHAPRLKAEIDKSAPQGWYYTEQKGKNYGVPTLYAGQYTTPVSWRTDLLEKAGVTKIPETIDEMTQAFAALKKIGVYGASSNGNSYYLTFQKIFGAYGVMPTQWMVKDGKVVNGATEPEAKEALTLLADWYKNGYIDPEFITGKDLGPKYLDGKYAFTDNDNVGSTDESNPSSNIVALKKLNPNGKIEFGPLPKGPKGLSGGWSWGSAGNMYAFGVQLEKQPEKLAKALEIIDAAVNEEDLFVRLAFGIQGKHWEFKNGKDLIEGVKVIPPYDDGKKLQEEGIYGGGKSFFGGTPTLDLHYKYYGEKLLNVYKQYGNKPVEDIFGKPDILPSAGQYWGDLKKLKVEAYAKIIRGDVPVSYFDTFVKQWNDMGGEQLRKEGQALYDSMQKK
ncbi:MAG: extracellular solute-binding protein family 1 [Paenibacillaceae bacterium]|nr:extracellular solute-binding protein family 1 [Paenibacillaceae bacterium]